MPTQPNSRLDVLTREIDLEAAIQADTRKKEMFDQESRAAARRIKAAKSALNILRSSMGLYSPNGENQPAPQKPPLKRRRPKKIGERKIDFVMAAISSITAPEFTPNDILEALRRLYPEADITRAGLSSLMWKLSKLPEGQKLFKQTVPWSGGQSPARYAKIEEGVRTRTRAPLQVLQPDLSKDLTAGKNGK